MDYLKVWTSFRELMEPLSDAEKGRLFEAMLAYAENGEEPAWKGTSGSSGRRPGSPSAAQARTTSA